MNRKYLLYGLGLANQAVFRFMQKRGIPAKVYSDGDKSDFENLVEEADIIVKSPGIFPDTPLLQLAKKLGKEIIGDLELFYRLKPPGKIICVTGTNGKTTVCRLLSEILQTKYRVLLGGNIGIPLFELAEEAADFWIIEASSYMLSDTLLFRPNIAIVLNLFPNHLDHHGNVEGYYQAKKKILFNMTEEDFFIYNSSDFLLSAWASETKAKAVPFSKTEIPESFLSINPSLIGQHNKANLQAVITLAKLLNIPEDSFKTAVQKFSLPLYRLEKVWESNDFIIYNDSKATNPWAAKVALETFSVVSPPTIWIAGGKKRGDDFGCLKETLKNVQRVYLWGENAEEVAYVLRKQKIPYCINSDLEQILKEIQREFTRGVILFSPGAQSFDRFSSFEERGAYFNKIAKQIFNF